MRTFDLFIEQQASENTREAYRNDMSKWLAFLGDREPTEQIVLDWRNHLESSGASSTAIRAFSTVRSFYRWAGLDNPFDAIKAPRRIKNWTPSAPDETDVANLKKVCSNPVEYAIIELLDNGLRVSEVIDLDVDDLTFESEYQTWVLKITGKGQKVRFVPLNTESAEAVVSILPKSGKIFPRMNRRKVYYLFEKYTGAKLHPHALRHGYATRLIRNDVNVLSVQKLLGHARTETTSLYVNLELSDLVEATKRDPRNQTERKGLRLVG